MKIAILSDIHNNKTNLKLALDRIKENGVEHIIGLGDYVSKEILQEFIDLNLPGNFVWGNNDSSKKEEMLEFLKESNSPLNFSDQAIHGRSFDIINLDGKNIVIGHFPEIAMYYGELNKADIIFFGHTHYKFFEKVGETIFANPGEILGKRSGISSFIIWDTKNDDMKFIDLN
ncbi:MAG: YfcE family phosphodiesterase [Candidatus Gracilibacteria bacterium]|nr:YfcE family phosphodiesterase [Candidatus Gracilibacteria bacterium]MDD4529959.1 YfcE family phosphodiesterase [Candidatus Gracilibacteria bacterium]